MRRANWFALALASPVFQSIAASWSKSRRPSFSLQLPGTHRRRSATSPGGSCNLAKSSITGGLLIRTVVTNPVPLSNVSMSRTSASSFSGGASMRMAPAATISRSIDPGSDALTARPRWTSAI